ncbi:nucleoside permease [Bacillus cereus]|uniref:nucleoside permease n=1 Tax=Bacillaceae TaxID=186817 RepID=UPI000BF6681F|nr:MULTISPECIES: nucleoside permease [Bacillus cereus group]MBE5097462.1 nucleoside permease [Bacillus thuringiensis]MDA2434527.1 nucleoside permease [Bacillus cereus]MDA2650453.1 nucleoside permease [Bacillus cereus]MDZ4545286.1 nucleoside permease [Bacillus cereus]MDZ4604065.1 nucleoside permease [Bacillus cereus]
MTLNRWLTDEEYARAAANGINRKRLQSRVYDFGWDVEEAITASIGTVRHEYKRKHGDWQKTALKNGINIGTFYSRLKLGWTYQDAATKPPRQKDKTEKAWLNIAKKNGIGYQTFISRIRTQKWDMERAATTPVINTGRRCSMKDKEEAL